MKNQLLKIIGVLALLSIPNSLNKNYTKKIYEIENPQKVYNSEQYKDKIKDINENIFSLNRKKNFFENRINEIDIPSITKEDYTKNLNEIEKEIIKYQKQKDSIYKLLNKK